MEIRLQLQKLQVVEIINEGERGDWHNNKASCGEGTCVKWACICDLGSNKCLQ